MVEGPCGYVPKAGTVETFVSDSLSGKAAGHDIDVLALSPLIDSADVGPGDWNRIAEAILGNHERYDGFVVTHGTDTLAYTSAALCFALRGLEKPVIVTGSMLPLTVAGTDGVANLTDALHLASSNPAGVWVRFAGKSLHGARVYKTHSHKMDAFAAATSSKPPVRVGDQPVAELVKPWRVGIIAASPGMTASLLRHAAEQCDGIVLRCYGSGTVPSTTSLREALASAQKREIPIVAVSQCAEGGIAIGTYAAGAVLIEHGVVDGRDMTVEAAYAKTFYALSGYAEPSERRGFLEGSAAGEF